MEILRRVGIWLSKAGLQFALFGWVIATSLVLLIGTPVTIKKTLDSSGLYAQLPDMILDQSGNVTSNGSVPLDDATIRSVIKTTFSASQLKSYSENLIDGTYTWLEGKSTEPTFSIDLSAARTSIAQGVADRAAERLKGLPPCTRIPTGSLDPFTIDCLPPGIDINREKQRMLNEVLANKDFLPNSHITAATLPKNAEGKTFVQQYANAPDYFGLLKQLPWWFVIIAVLSASAFLWLASDKRRAIRSLGRMTLATGSFILVPTILFGVLLPTASNNLQAHVVGNAAAPALNNVIKSIVNAFTRVTIITSGVLVLIGGMTLLLERFIKSSHPEEAPADAAAAVDQIIAEERAKKATKETKTEE